MIAIFYETIRRLYGAHKTASGAGDVRDELGAAIKSLRERFDAHWHIKRSLQYDVIETTLERHDATNLETTVAYKRHEESDRKQRFQIQFMFFFPETILKDGYSSKNFFGSLTNNMRLGGTDMPPSEFLNLVNPASPLARLDALHKEHLLHPQLSRHQEIIDNTRYAAAYIMQSLRSLDISNHFVEGYDVFAHYETELALCKSILNALRGLLTQFEIVFSRRLGDTLSSLKLIDEYISINIEKRWIRVLNLQKVKAYPQLMGDICNMLKEELAYREKFSFLAKSDPTSLKDKRVAETFRHRLSILKRFVQNQLYLNVKYVNTNSYIAQTVAGIAAGIAAAFAYTADSMSRGQLGGTNWQQLWGPGVFIVVFTCIYIIKDRIKEILRKIIQSKIDVYDLRRKICLPGDKSTFFAETREQVHIIPAERVRKRIPEWAITLRRKKSTGDIGPHRKEKVVIYTKDISIDWEALNKKQRECHQELKEIYRFNLHDFLERMDNPVDVEQFFDPSTQEVIEIDIPRVYHVNIILSICPVKKLKKQVVEESRFSTKVRVVINKTGIQRVDFI